MALSLPKILKISWQASWPIFLPCREISFIRWSFFNVHYNKVAYQLYYGVGEDEVEEINHFWTVAAN